MATKAEIEALKQNWLADPCYEIEFAPGFEAHEAELAEWRRKQEERQEAARQARLLAKAERIGCAGNTTLAAYVETLEDQIERLRREIRRFDN